jgi:predicted Zn-dependent protease with MMP-like domain
LDLGTEYRMSDQRNPMHDFGAPPSIEDITVLAERAIAAIPREFMAHATDVAVIVEERADDETLREMHIETPWELSGLYRGVPLPARSVMAPVRLPDRIFLYREAILLEWIETGEDLFCLVRNVVIHEIAHHFGFSDAEIAAIESDTEPE